MHRLVLHTVMALMGAALAGDADQPAANVESALPGSAAQAPENAAVETPAESAPGAGTSDSTAPAETAEAKKPEPADKTPELEAFDKLVGEWKDLLAELVTLQEKYRAANSEEHAAIEKQWDTAIAKGEELRPKIVEAAEKAYVAAPNTQKEVSDFLERVLRSSVASDDYELAFEVGSLLDKNKAPIDDLPRLMGKASFGACEFDAAERYFEQLQKTGRLDATVGTLAQSLPKYKEAWPKEQKIREAEAKADDLPRVLLKTNKGDITVELFENEAPNTVANFVSLVESGYYDGLTFHRVLPGFMAQAGCPKGDGSGGPGYRIECECDEPNHRLHFRGSLSMAKTAQPDTGGSQFFLTFQPTPHLDGQHTVFGRVIDGMGVMAELQRIDPDDPRGEQPDKILKAEVLRKRDHEYKPKTLPERG